MNKFTGGYFITETFL